MTCCPISGLIYGCLVERLETMENDTGRSRFAMMIAATRALGTCLLAVVSIAASAASRKLTEFMGAQAQLRSPDGRYVVENVDSDKEPHHTLLLKNTETGAVRTLCNYSRHVTVLWSPDRKKFSVNDYAGSDFSKILIFSADQESPPQDIGAELLQSLKDSPDRRSLADNHHVYFAVSSWEENDAVKLKAWGHGEVDPKGFSRLYQYSLGGSFRRVR
jgi:hypothetical protein